jgi:hypothetical protein
MPDATNAGPMRGTVLVLTVAFVFASSPFLLGQASGQSDPMPPEECCEQPPTDATLSGVVRSEAGEPLAGAHVSVSSYGPYYAEKEATEGSGDGSSGSSGASRSCCWGGYNSTTTDAQGRYSLGVWSGEMQVHVSAEGHAGSSAKVSVEPGQAATQDFALKAYPPKTAHIAGKVTDARTGAGLGFASVSVRSPWYGLYECSVSQASGGSSGGGTAEPAREGADSDVSIMPYPYHDPGCAITVHEDGTYEGYVTPGYSIVSVHAWQDCSVSRDADGSGSTACGPEYLGWTRTLTLAANETTRVDVRLPSRPAPDATVSGYLLDVETGEAIRGATISFSNQETYAWGSATTDEDGSYSLRLRSGYHSVHVYADGYLGWEGVLQVPKGSTPYDVQLTPGQDSHGGCCVAYAMESKAGAPQAASDDAVATGGSAGMAEDRDSGSADGEVYQDLGGGLGPYDASDRREALVESDGDAAMEPSKGAPGAGLLLAGLAVGLALAALRRRSA